MAYNDSDYVWPITDMKIVDQIAGERIPYIGDIRHDGKGDFGTEIFKRDLFRNILLYPSYDGGVDGILNIGLGTDLMLSAETRYTTYNVCISIGDRTKEVTSGDSDDYDDCSYSEIDNYYADTYKIGLTEDEINSVSSNYERCQLFLNKIHKELEQHIIPEVLAKKEKEFTEKLNGIREAQKRMSELNAPKASSPNMEP